MISLDKLKEIILENFTEPFLPGGFVKFRDVSDIYKEPALSIDIGDRNITIGGNGDRFAAGSNVDEATEWEIKRTK